MKVRRLALVAGLVLPSSNTASVDATKGTPKSLSAYCQRRWQMQFEKAR
jgi:hypothetical protein